MGYNYRNPPPKLPPMVFEQPGRTRQSEAKACDINHIMARYKKTGVIPVGKRAGLYVDVSAVGDYREALHQIQYADDLFMKLPAKVRGRFGNDPAEFLDFCSDPANREEMVELGLIESPEKVEEPPVEPAADVGTGDTPDASS